LKRRDDEWTRRWRSIPPEQRRRIVRAVARGKAVSDPRDAPLALEVIAKREQKLQSARTGWFSRWLWRHLAIVACIGVVAAVLFHDFFVIGAAVLTALYVIGFRVFLRRLETSIAEARRNNERLVQL
jgi:hypothetical protein